MSAWLIPQRPLSEQARAYRQRWADRWGALDPPHGYDAPEGALYTHLHACPEFRSPLSPDEEARASAEFHQEALRRLARGRPITVITFDWEWEGDGGGSETTLVEIPSQERDLWVSYVEDPEDTDRTITHAFRTEMRVDDPRVVALVDRVAVGNVAATFTAHDLSWVARPNEECMALNSFIREDLEILEAVELEIWAKWGIHRERRALLDLAEVVAEFEERRPAWEQSGVTVDTGPQFRSWDGDRIDILSELPADLSSVDWFLVGFASRSAEATVIVFDTGTCQVMIDPDPDDPDADTIFEYREQPGSHDLDAVVATFERVVASLGGAPRS